MKHDENIWRHNDLNEENINPWRMGGMGTCMKII
jgi:hypothetical protein